MHGFWKHLSTNSFDLHICRVMCSNLGDKFIMAELNPIDWKCDNPQVRFR
ncbi:hypothetical protein CK203_076319 [Vitis vinifera]|uniref:Uncharacterized protein n=1 Tax=Vitis vinifera TaxID=29760 RepID=A0A438E5C7_VITVI|nr:hypothetical protein CK203_076319 [Vitis vinifera]